MADIVFNVENNFKNYLPKMISILPYMQITVVLILFNLSEYEESYITSIQSMANSLRERQYVYIVQSKVK
jgi:flagellar biosynthesis protein FliQ